MCIIVTGVPGVGKSTVMENAAKAKSLPIVNYGTIMFEIAQAKKYVKDRDEMRKMPLERQREVQEAAADKIHAMGKVIVDTHATIKTPQGYMPGLPEWVVRKLKPQIIALVETEPKEIAARRAKDPTRKRDDDSPEAIAEHQMMNRAVAMSYATISGGAVIILQNRDGKPKEAADKLIAAL